MTTPAPLFRTEPNALARAVAYATTGRFWAYVGLVLGAAASLAANVRHTYLPPEGAPVDWSPGLDAIIAAVFWPIALFVGLEVMARSNFAAGWRGWAFRLIGVGPVTLVAGIASYLHLSGLLEHLGETDAIVELGPLGVDGLMLMCSAVLVSTAKKGIAPVAPVARPAARRPYAWAVPAGARTLPIIPKTAPTPAPAVRPRVSGWVSAPRGARVLPIRCARPAAPAHAPSPIRPRRERRPVAGKRPLAETKRLAEELMGAARERGEKLTQAQVAEKLGISRWTLRDALALKTDEALVA